MHFVEMNNMQQPKDVTTEQIAYQTQQYQRECKDYLPIEFFPPRVQNFVMHIL